MDDPRKMPSGIIVIIGWLVVGAVSMWLISYGSVWYNVGQLKLCSRSETNHFALERPVTRRELMTPQYWCFRGYAAQFVTPENNRGSREQREVSGVPKYTESEVEKAESKRQQGVELGNYNDTYAGIKKYWGDDIIGSLFDSVGLLAKRMVVDKYPDLIDPYIVAWNSFFVGEDLENGSHRSAVVFLAAAFFGAFISLLVPYTLVWLAYVAHRKPRQTKTA